MREKLGSNSKQNASSNAPNVDKNSMLLNVSHKNHSDCCNVRKNLKDSFDSFLGTKMITKANVDSNKTKNENTKTESAIDEMTVVKVNEFFITDNCTARKKKQKTYALAVTENVEKTTDRNVSCLKKELQLGNGEKTIDLTKIKNVLLQDEKLNSSRIQTSPPVRFTNSSTSRNTLNTSENMFDLAFLSTQDEDLVNILEELQNRTEVSGDNITEITSSNCLKGYFCSHTVFNLSHRVLPDAEIKILEKDLDFAPTQRKINEPELRKDFEEFCHRMRIKWHFWNEPTSNFSNIPTFAPKSVAPKGHPNLEVFLWPVESDLFKAIERPLGYSNLSKEEWDTIRSLADDRNIVIKRADKGSCVVIWDRNDYVKEAEI